MPIAARTRAPIANRILTALPDEEYEHLRPYLEPVSLAYKEVLYEVGAPIPYAYFLNEALISVIATTRDGAAVEVAIAGNEGMIGISAFLGNYHVPYRAVVQVPGSALRIKAEALKAEFNKGGLLHDLLHHYLYALLVQLAQSVACNRLHQLEQRLSRWLLVARDRAQSDQFYLTQELLSLMLGVGRNGVNTAAGSLRQKGLIDYSRGKITILDQAGLALVTCECYGIVKEVFDNFLALDG